ncbi:MAG: aspartate aminotransferase family protein [Bacillota bacterium]|nr:aspartate aminotransferase family protein [Bacillota bacterium]
MDKRRAIELQKRYLVPAIGTYYEEPLVVSHGQGHYLYDIEGREYLDFFGGILTVSIGHADPRINARIHDQVDRVVHTSTLYVNLPQVELAERLAKLVPGGLSQWFFTNSGTEANETAVTFARAHTGRDEVIALRHSYSGRSTLAMALTGQSVWRLPGSNQPAIRHAHNPYCYRCALGQKYPACDLLCARDIEEVIRTSTSGRIAAFIAEPIQGVGGFITPPPGYFQTAVEIIRRYGGLFICDEVQTGWGRTGGKMFGIEQWDVVPDLMTFAKGLANGLPIGATVTTEEIGASLRGLTISTFGGNPLTMAAASAVLDVIVDEGLPAKAVVTGGHLRAGLEALAQRFPVIGDVRGMGLMQGVELVRDRKTKEPAPEVVARLFEETRRRGLLIGKGGMYGNVLRITPMLDVQIGEIDTALRILTEAFEALPSS